MILVPLSNIVPNPWQPRRSFNDDAITALMTDIKARAGFENSKTKGLLQVPNGRFVDKNGAPFPAQQVAGFLVDLSRGWVEGVYVQLAFGHSRCEAFRRLDQEGSSREWSTFPVEIQIWNDQVMATAAWTENAARKDLNPMEEAIAIEKMMWDFEWTQDKAAEVLNLNRSTVANKLRLLRLPDVAKEKLQSGDLSERQAMALLPLQNMPDVVKAKISIENLIKETEGMPSDRIRRHIEDLTSRHTFSLQPYRTPLFPLDEHIEGKGILSPTCTGCTHFMKGDEPRCPIADCVRAKHRTHHIAKLTPASQATGLPIAPPNKSWGEYEDMRDTSVIKHALEVQCGKVEITEDGYGPKYFPDFPTIRLTCHKGDGKQCSCARAVAAANSKTATKGMSLGKAKEAYKTDLLQPAGGAFAEALRTNHPGAWKALYRSLFGYHSAAAELTMEQRQLAIACKVLEDGMYEPWRDLDRAKGALTNALKSAELQAPWNTTELQKLQAGWDYLEEWYRESLKKVRSAEEVDKGIQQYAELRAYPEVCEVEGLFDRTERARWEEKIAQRMGSLRLLWGFLTSSQWGEADYTMITYMAWVATDALDGSGFKSGLGKLDINLLRYLEILLQHIEGQRQRYDAIRIEIKRRKKPTTPAATAAD